MSPKIDFVFKLLFGDERNKDLLISFLSAVLDLLEIPQLFDEDILKDEEDPIVQWMEFLDGKSKGVMEMLAKKNESIKKAYSLLQIISKDEKARMIYEAREAEHRDQLTRIKCAEEKGANEKSIKIAQNLLRMGLSVQQVASAVEIEIDEVEMIKEDLMN